MEDITEVLWKTRVSSGMVSKLNQQIYEKIELWRNRHLSDPYPYVFLDGIVLKRSWAGEVRKISVLVAIGVSSNGYREVIGVAEGAKEDKEGWSSFLRHLKTRSLSWVQLFITDKCIGLVMPWLSISLKPDGSAVACTSIAKYSVSFPKEMFARLLRC